MIKTLTTLVLAIILFTSFISSASAQILSGNVSVEVRLAPSQVEAEEGTYSIGYVNLINRAGVPVKSLQDVTIRLTSAYPDIASVPEFVTIKVNDVYTTFDVKVGDSKGITTIFANYGGQTVFQELLVGEVNVDLPDNLELVIHLPSKSMHVDSEMPFSVFLKNTEGDVIQAPHDITIRLDFEESLVSLNENQWMIKKGAYYAWGTVSTSELVGTAFIRASQDELNIHTAEGIKISSSLPTGLKVNVFPQIVAKELDRNIDIIVSLIDSQGFPALAQEDVYLEFFADNTYVGEQIDETMKEARTNGIIKKGDFSYHFREELNLNNQGKEITIGASAKGLGIAFDCFMMRDAYTTENPLAIKKTMHVFTLDQIPSNSQSAGIYQIGTLITLPDEDDLEELDDEPCVDLERFDTDQNDSSNVVEFHPILSNENLSSEGTYQKVNLISSNSLLLNIEKIGNIESGTSYGTAKIQTGQETGTASLSATIKGIGSATSPTQIVNTLKHHETMIFSPIGSNTILFDKNGKFDLFVISLDGNKRPTFVENEAKYLLLPINELVEIEKGKTFAHSNFPSESFATNDEDPVTMEAIPVGVSADESLKAVTSYNRNPSSQVQIILPYDEIDIDSYSPYKGIVQLLDLEGNPIVVSNELKVKLESTLPEGTDPIVQTPRFVTIKVGSSFAEFDITPLGIMGNSGIAANANGVIGSEKAFTTRSFLTQLSISSGSINEPLVPGESVELKVYVDDQYLESVPGAALKIVTDGHGTVTPTYIQTEADGSAKIHFTPSREYEIFSFEIFATADGYVEDKKTFTYTVATDGSDDNAFALGVPDWLIYIGIGIVVVIIAIMVVFLKKPKRADDEEDELELFEDDEI
ncbi:MAG: hypothetical protein IH792_05465 [Thaumarchaeota archaeon]|nr:hypothetical protein [Nitrososphaerota archaeon]